MKVIKAIEVPAITESHLPTSLAAKMGSSEWRGLSESVSLSQFGANLEILHPGAQGSLRHWHSLADELIYILSGELTLVSNGKDLILTEGDCAGFPAGEEDGHHLVNRSNNSAKFLVVGSRISEDRPYYPDDDLQWVETVVGSFQAARKDGSLY